MKYFLEIENLKKKCLSIFVSYFSQKIWLRTLNYFV